MDLNIITTLPIEHSNAQADALFASIGDGAIAIDENGKIYRVNKAALIILGLREEDLIGKWFPKVIMAVNEDGTPVKRMERPVTRALLTGQTISERCFYRTPVRDKMPVDVTVAPIILNGKPTGAIEVFRDASDDYELDKMKSEFISLASHQLRTPLTAITTYASMLMQGFQGDLTQAQQEFIQIILSSSERMNEIIDTLLSASRLESGNAKLNISKVSLNELLANTLQELWPLAEARNQDLRTRILAKDLSIQTDPLLLTEACTNLLSNAIKYTPEGGRVTVSLSATKEQAKIEVKDTGYGIPQALQKRVFTKFFRASNILHEESVGTGLGLYMVKQIVDNLWGVIDFISQENVGTTFTIRLPLKTAPQPGKNFRIT